VADPFLQRRPRLAYPFTILTSPNTVRLVAGEDYRYTLTAPELDRWLLPLLERFLGKETLQTLCAALTPPQREAALQVIQHLYGERVLVDGSANDAHVAQKYHIVIEGSGGLRELMAGSNPSPPAPLPQGERGLLLLLCQDRLDYEAALRTSRRCRETMTPMLWASYGAMNRAYVSPLFLPDAGPCFGCLLRSFQRLSPAPEIYDALREHAQQNKAITPVDFPYEGLLMLQGVLLWKLHEAEREFPGPALYRLHVLEREHFEVSTHRVFIDPLCPECGKERR
jgi:bacteriocin biosynthesis cyclodehydratase domain-containing protein